MKILVCSLVYSVKIPYSNKKTGIPFAHFIEFFVPLQRFMEKITRHICILVMWVLMSMQLSAQNGGLDSISISILTCTPGTDLYAKFGHTALRVKDYTLQKDIVFNYGCFDGSANDFVFKFVLGQTDYLLEAEPFDYLVARYGDMGNGVKEQVLNLTKEEANKLLFLLLDNIRPENQEYRYVWLYDNCTERARDMVEKAVAGKVVYEREVKPQTIRQMLHECLKDDPWVCFGIDLILGAEIDQKIDKRIQMFLPDFFSAEADAAYIERADGSKAPYVIDTNSIIQETLVKEEASMLTSPVVMFTLLLAIAILLFVQEWRKGRYEMWWDMVLHALQGLAGIVVGFLFFFSSHPAVDSNWLVIIFNPLPLFYAVWLVFCQMKGKKNVFAYVNLAVIAGFFVVMLTCTQSFNPAMYLLVLALLVRAMSQAHFVYHGSTPSFRFNEKEIRHKS